MPRRSFAGRDDNGAHLFVVTDPGILTCADSVAFASIGTGKPHADSYFMMAHHTRNTDSHKALLDIYIAKRRSEVSPTVGADTDLFVIGGDGFRDIDSEIQKRLEAIRAELDERIRMVVDIAGKEATQAIDAYLAERDTPLPSDTPKAGAAQEKSCRQKRYGRREEEDVTQIQLSGTLLLSSWHNFLERLFKLLAALIHLKFSRCLYEALALACLYQTR